MICAKFANKQENANDIKIKQARIGNIPSVTQTAKLQVLNVENIKI